MDSRLEKMFEESRKRHSKKNTQVKVKKEKQSAEQKRAKKLAYHYHWHDINTYNFNCDNDLDEKWITDNILSKECIYCGETDWRKLGCDRIDNTKPHTKDNVVCACARCNKLRSNKFTVDEMIQIGAVIKRIENKHKDYCLREGKKVGSFDLLGVMQKEYKAAAQTQEDGYVPTMVRRACQSGKSYKGFKWRYLE